MNACHHVLLSVGVRLFSPWFAFYKRTLLLDLAVGVESGLNWQFGAESVFLFVFVFLIYRVHCTKYQNKAWIDDGLKIYLLFAHFYPTDFSQWVYSRPKN